MGKVFESNQKMNQQQQTEFSQLLIEVGRQLHTLVVEGNAIAHKSQQDWYEFAVNLLSGGSAFDRVQRPLKEAVELYERHYTNCGTEINPVDLKAVQYYIVAKVVRDVRLKAAALADKWYFICHDTEIPNPGDFVTVQLFCEPLVAVRQGDGSIKVFLNVCPHRQCLVFERTGCMKVDKPILCPYHGWGFSEKGECTNAPGANRGEFGDDFDLKNYSLRSCEVSIDANQAVFAKLVTSETTDASTVQPVYADGSINGQNAGVAIAELLQEVSPGYEFGITATLPEEIRLWIKVGYLGEQLKHLVTPIARERGITSKEILSGINVNPTEKTQYRELLLESVMAELRQLLLMVEGETTSLRLEDLLEGVERSGTRAVTEETQEAIAPVPALEEEVAERGDRVKERRIALPIWTYGDAELFALEIEHLIAPTWQFVCHVSEIPRPHQYTWLDIVGERAYAIRTANGDLFAGKLKHVDARSRSPLTPLRKGVESLEIPIGQLGQWGKCLEGEELERAASDYGLEPIDIEVFYGFIFIRLLRQGPRLKDIWHQPGLLEPYKLEELQLIDGPDGHYEISVEVDYKLLWENFLEDYHFPMMHKGLTFRFGVSSDCEGINGMIIPMRDPASPKLKPIEQQYYECAKTLGRHGWDREKELAAIAAERHFLPEPLCYSAFCSMAAQEEMPMPFSLSVFPEHVQAFAIVPGGPREARFHVRSYGPVLDPAAPETEIIKAAQQANIQLLIESLHEDIRVNYITQDSVTSQLFEKLGVFSIAEWDVAKFQEAVQINVPVTSYPQKPSQLVRT